MEELHRVRKISDKLISNQFIIMIIMEIILPILIILVCAKISGEIFARIRQPPIIGEMMAGVVLGPSILNLISPEMNGIDVGLIYGLDLMDTFFISIVFSLTALPVGVQILMDLGKLESETGKIIITSAVIDDILCMFFFAMVGKGLGAFTGGVLANMKMKDALAVGIGLNARGLMGLMISGRGF